MLKCQLNSHLNEGSSCISSSCFISVIVRRGGGVCKLKCISGRRGRFGMLLSQEYISKYLMVHCFRGGNWPTKQEEVPYMKHVAKSIDYWHSKQPPSVVRSDRLYVSTDSVS